MILELFGSLVNMRIDQKLVFPLDWVTIFHVLNFIMDMILCLGTTINSHSILNQSPVYIRIGQ